MRRAAGAKVVAITGSAGKTTTKESIAALLATRFRVVKNKGNLNNHIGLPLSLMQLTSGPDVAVMELGMNHAGEIRTLVRIAEPDVRVWTNVGDAHLGFFASVDAIADAKAEILEGARPGDVLVCAADDARVMARAGGFAGRRVTFGESPDADVRASDVRDLGLGRHARAGRDAGRRLRPRHAAPRARQPGQRAGGHRRRARVRRAARRRSRDTAATLRPADRRGVVRHLRDGITLIDDSYNSSPSALTARAGGDGARDARRRPRGGARRDARARRSRRGAAPASAAAPPPRPGCACSSPSAAHAARALADAAVAAGMPRGAVHHLRVERRRGRRTCRRSLRAGDLVLVKGSRGTRCDVVRDRIVQERG